MESGVRVLYGRRRRHKREVSVYESGVRSLESGVELDSRLPKTLRLTSLLGFG